MHITKCRFCQGKLGLVLSLGQIPIVNYFPSKKELSSEKKFPLDFCVCENCGLAQLSYIVPKEDIFKSYHFLTGASKPLVDHLKKLAGFLIVEFKLGSKSKVLDIGSNDGTLLLEFKKRGIQTLGIEPALNMTRVTKNKNLDTIEGFFDGKSSRKILKKYGKFDLISATRVLANVMDINDFISGVSLLLSSKGVFVAEVSALSEMLFRYQFDSIYHEHYSYFSFSTLSKILEKHNLRIFKLEKSVFQGGELRIFATHRGNISEKLYMKDAVTKKDYIDFANNVKKFRKRFISLIDSKKGLSVAGFGAPAKGVTLLNYCDVGIDKISFIVDSTPFKQGRYMPGVHIPIFKESYLKDKNIDYCLLLAWSYKQEILKKIKKMTKKNTKVIIPFPKLDIINL